MTKESGLRVGAVVVDDNAGKASALEGFSGWGGAKKVVVIDPNEPRFGNEGAWESLVVAEKEARKMLKKLDAVVVYLDKGPLLAAIGQCVAEFAQIMIEKLHRLGEVIVVMTTGEGISAEVVRGAFGGADLLMPDGYTGGAQRLIETLRGCGKSKTLALMNSDEDFVPLN